MVPGFCQHPLLILRPGIVRPVAALRPRIVARAAMAAAAAMQREAVRLAVVEAVLAGWILRLLDHGL